MFLTILLKEVGTYEKYEYSPKRLYIMNKITFQASGFFKQCLLNRLTAVAVPALHCNLNVVL